MTIFKNQSHQFILTRRHPFIMSQLNSLIQRTKQYILNTTKSIISNHKKKLIAGVILIVAGYIIKKKMTMAHLITIIESITKIIQYLPLPDSPKLRQLNPYEHPEPIPLRAIMNAVKVDDIKARITRKEGTWDDLKDAIFTGATLTLVLYNINSFYFVVQNKYHQEFKQLKALEQFEQAMYSLRKRFVDEVPRIFTDLQMMIQPELNTIELQEAYNLQDISSIFDKLTQKVFQNKFQTKQQLKKSIIHRSHKEAVNYFSSIYEMSPEKKSSFFVRAAGGILSFLGGTIRVFDWFPEAKPEVSSERYDFIRKAYLISALKADIEGIRWPNDESKSLLNLVFEEIIYMILSLNFSVLVVQHCNYQKQILMNRIHLWLVANRCSNAKTVKMLPAIFKILKEEFFKDDIFKLRDTYHQKQLRRSIKLSTLQQIPAENEEEVSLEETVLAEIQGKKAYQYLQKEFELKYFNERSGIVHRPKKHETEGKQARDMQKMLNLLGGSEALNQQE